MRFDTGTTNKEFAKMDEGFMEACERAKIKATGRQASKWRNKKGLAYRYRGRK